MSSNFVGFHVCLTFQFTVMLKLVGERCHLLSYKLPMLDNPLPTIPLGASSRWLQLHHMMLFVKMDHDIRIYNIVTGME